MAFLLKMKDETVWPFFHLQFSNTNSAFLSFAAGQRTGAHESTSKPLVRMTTKLGCNFLPRALESRSTFRRLVKGDRFNSSIAARALNDFDEDPELARRRGRIAKHLTGKPFDDAEKYSTPENPTTHTVEKHNPDIIPSPFVYLDETVALNIILSESSQVKELGKYDYFLRMKWDSSGSFDDKIDLVLNWSKRFKGNYKLIPPLGDKINLKITDELKSAMINSLCDEESFDLKKALDDLSNSFPKYSFESLALLFIKIIPELPVSQQEVFINSVNEFFPQNILHFHDQILESICHELVLQKRVKSVTTILHAYNEFSHSESDFLSVVSKSFCELYLKGLIGDKDVQTARRVLETIVNAGYAPNSSVLTGYFDLVSEACNQANASKDKKEMLFNIFTKPVSSLILKDGMLNEPILRTMAGFIRLAIIPQFIAYLKLCPSFKSINYIPDVIIERILESQTYHSQTDQQKVIFLSGIIGSLEMDAKKISDATKRKIIKLYSDAHSPLAVLFWTRLLEKPLSETEKSDLLNRLPGDTDNVSGSFDIAGKL